MQRYYTMSIPVNPHCMHIVSVLAAIHSLLNLFITALMYSYKLFLLCHNILSGVHPHPFASSLLVLRMVVHVFLSHNMVLLYEKTKKSKPEDQLVQPPSKEPG